MRRALESWSLATLACCLFMTTSSALAQPASRSAPPSPPAPPIEPLRTAGDRPATIRNIKLELNVDLHKKLVDSKATIQFSIIRPIREISLDAVDFGMKQVMLTAAGKGPMAAAHNYDGKKLLVDLGSVWPAGQSGTIEVSYRVASPRNGLHFFAPSKSMPDAPLMVWSQGEEIENRYWFPCYDEPDQRQTTEVVATVPAGFEAVSNGKLVARKENPGAKTVTFDWVQDKPHAAYLVTLVVGEFDVVRTEWEGIPVLYYMPKGRGADAIPTYGRTPQMLGYFSRRFGIRYPWDKYAQVTVYRFGGGMENTSATTMTDRIMIDQRTLLDRNSDSIVSHELAHQWWGDLLTCRDWSHVWLNEGFASYAEALWDEESGGPDEYAYNMFGKAGPAIGGGKRRPVMDRHYISPGAMFDARAYPKGAWVLHMLRLHLGEEPFWKGIQKYGTEYRLQSVETNDFRRSMERTSGRDLERFFYDWLERPGNPDVEVTTEYTPGAPQARILVKQTQAGEPFHFPVKLVLYGADNKQMTVIEREMTDSELRVEVPISGELTRIDVDPDQAILTRIKEIKSRVLWRAQLLHGASVPLRLQAVRVLNDGATDADRAILAEAFASERFWAIKIELAKALGSKEEARARTALLAGLEDSDARIRRVCVDLLGRYIQEPAVAARIKEILEKGDPSYGVQIAALQLYPRMNQKDAVAFITPWLSKPAFEHNVTNAALQALAATKDPAAVDAFITWANPDKPLLCRFSAQRGMLGLMKDNKLDEGQREKVMITVINILKGADDTQRRSILMSLPDLGSSAVAALPAVDQIANAEPADSLQTLAKRTAKQLRALAKPVPAPTPPVKK